MRRNLIMLLLDPTNVEGGGLGLAPVAEFLKAPPVAEVKPVAETKVEPEVKATPKPVAEVKAKPVAEAKPSEEDAKAKLLLTPEEYREFQEMKASLATLRATFTNTLSEKEKETIRLTAEKNASDLRAAEAQRVKEAEADKLRTDLASLQQRLDTADAAALEKLRDDTVNQAMRGIVFTGRDAATQSRAAETFYQLAIKAVKVEKGEDGKPVVKSADGTKSAAEALKAFEAEHDYLIARRTKPGVINHGGQVPAGASDDDAEKEWFAEFRRRNSNLGVGLQPIANN